MNKLVRFRRRSPVDGAMERCVLCWRLTNVPENKPVSMRKYYLEGQGQLCVKCYYMLFKERVFLE